MLCGILAKWLCVQFTLVARELNMELLEVISRVVLICPNTNNLLHLKKCDIIH